MTKEKSIRMEENPLLQPAATPYGLPPFDRIELQHYEPAFEQALAVARDEIKTITENPAAPTFETVS